MTNLERKEKIKAFSNEFSLILANLKPFLTESALAHKFE